MHLIQIGIEIGKILSAKNPQVKPIDLLSFLITFLSLNRNSRSNIECRNIHDKEWNNSFTSSWFVLLLLHFSKTKFCLDCNYFQVSESIWNFFSSNYGGGPELLIRSNSNSNIDDQISLTNKPAVTFV
jgi:hypothetical protein